MDTAKNLKAKIKSFEKEVLSIALPTWDELPSIELYMDQVIVLLNRYIVSAHMAPVTQSMVNNYVKLKAIPAPVKKRYSKVHLAYLIIFCTLKQSLSIATIQKIMPVDLTESQVESLYSSFLSNRQKSTEYTIDQIKKISEGSDSLDVVMQISNAANVFKSLTENLLLNETE